MEIEKKQNSSKTLVFGLIAFAPIVIYFIIGLVLYLTQLVHDGSIHSLSGAIAVLALLSSLIIMPISIILSVLGIKTKAKLTKLEQTTQDKIGFILSIVSCVIAVCYMIVIIRQL